jgi:hypothetical protein
MPPTGMTLPRRGDLAGHRERVLHGTSVSSEASDGRDRDRPARVVLRDRTAGRGVEIAVLEEVGER